MGTICLLITVLFTRRARKGNRKTIKKVVYRIGRCFFCKKDNKQIGVGYFGFVLVKEKGASCVCVCV